MKHKLKTAGLTLLIFLGIGFSWEISRTLSLAYMVVFVPSFSLLARVCYQALENKK